MENEELQNVTENATNVAANINYKQREGAGAKKNTIFH